MNIIIKLLGMKDEGYLLLKNGNIVHQKSRAGQNFDNNTYSLIAFVDGNDEDMTLNFDEIENCDTDRDKLN